MTKPTLVKIIIAISVVVLAGGGYFTYQIIFVNTNNTTKSQQASVTIDKSKCLTASDVNDKTSPYNKQIDDFQRNNSAQIKKYQERVYIQSNIYIFKAII